ncbi:ubiquitin C-terminal hydrolase 13-like isoform X2 [Macadamia integrifolia]|uniref:ubiquitin C-terminal hydrolase 13-like isoform X2 n=1 Tax=Macadamia integrifolia TaxID=60698 RepID=UPI001C4EA62C|nr:ubiquitin C-terminal hydrolase 13-like isoform X2 [Macadamia integrifolia]XP_042503960.1 ubiquitin C-terminal hydrolase 13-like isoform X2 [Macadamia integrifolia]
MLVPHSSSADAPQPMEVALVEPTSTVENQPIEKPISNEFTWEIENFYGLSAEEHYSDIFNVGGYKWRMVIGLNCPGHLSLYLDVADSVNLPYGWCISAHFFLTVIDQYDAGNSYTYESEAHHHFSAKASCWGFDKFMHLTQLLDPDRKYIVDDKVKVGAVVTVKAVNDSKKETGYVGLKAQSDTHYMNSLFQTFYHIPFFRKVVYDIPTTKNDMLSESTPLALQSLFCKMQYSENSVVVKELRKFFEFRQYDVLEFSRFLCEKLEDKMKGTIVEDKIQKLFVGRQKNFTKFVNAECQLEKEESFYGLRLDVRGCRDVYDSFEKYVKVESLEGDRNYNDAQLGQQDTRKCVQFISFPPVLQLQLKRFEYDKYGFCTRKVRIMLPLILHRD